MNSTSNNKVYKFAVVPKQLSSPFFDVVHEGCVARAAKLGNVVCLYNGTVFPDVEGQAQIVRDLVTADKVDGVAVAVAEANASSTYDAIAFAIERGVPVITFDSDAAGSERLTYVGTNNVAFGDTLGKVLLQIDPTGGYYGIISTQAPNAIEREIGLRNRLAESKWVEHPTSPLDCVESGVIAIEKMREFASDQGLKAIVPVGGWPMRNDIEWSRFVDEYPHLTTVGADTLPHQMQLLKSGYVTGLVGQLPFQMGVLSMDVLLKHSTGSDVAEEVYGTELLEVITVPINRPDAVVNMNYIGNLKYLGFTFSGVVTMLSVSFALWTFVNRNHHVIRASQPVFLIMVAVGAVIMGSSTIPMSFDDENQILHTRKTCVVTCMASVWLISIGFTTIFSALFSKTWRINKIFHNPMAFSRIRVDARDVIAPFFMLLAANVLTLALMTAFAPLEYVRKAHAGTDDWNRIISSYGICESKTTRWGGAVPYFVTLAFINLSALVVANVQAYQARSIQSEFSESHYIAVAMAGMLQTAAIGFPVLFLLQDSPITSYVLKVCMVFIVAIVILCCIFVPKIMGRRTFDQKEIKSEKRISMLAAKAVRRRYPYESSSELMQRRQSSANNYGLKLRMSVVSEASDKHPSHLCIEVGGNNDSNSDLDDSSCGLRFVQSSMEQLNDETDLRHHGVEAEEQTAEMQMNPVTASSPDNR